MMWLSLAMEMKLPSPPLRLGLKYHDPPSLLPLIVTKMIVQKSINSKKFFLFQGSKSYDPPTFSTPLPPAY